MAKWREFRLARIASMAAGVFCQTWQTATSPKTDKLALRTSHNSSQCFAPSDVGHHLQQRIAEAVTKQADGVVLGIFARHHVQEKLTVRKALAAQGKAGCCMHLCAVRHFGKKGWVRGP
eukprot:6198396-Pleurochrysis_carterae.AAC.2